MVKIFGNEISGFLIFLILAVVGFAAWMIGKKIRGKKKPEGETPQDTHRTEETRQVQQIDQKLLKDKKEEKELALRLIELFREIETKSEPIAESQSGDIAHGLKSVHKFIEKSLNQLLSDDISIEKEEKLLKHLNDAINISLSYVKKLEGLEDLVSEVRKIQKKLNMEVIEEEELLVQKAALLAHLEGRARADH